MASPLAVERPAEGATVSFLRKQEPSLLLPSWERTPGEGSHCRASGSPERSKTPYCLDSRFRGNKPGLLLAQAVTYRLLYSATILRNG